MGLQTTLNCTIDLTGQQMLLLDNRCELMSYLERTYYADRIIKKKDVNQLKSQYQIDYDINARQFNSIRIALDGKVSSVLALAKEDLIDSQLALKKAKLKLSRIFKSQEFYSKKAKISPWTDKDLEQVNKIPKMMWYARQRIQKVEAKVRKLQDMLATGNPHICFGGRKLFLQQFQIDGGNNLTKFNTTGQVMKAWKDKRKQQFTLVGSKDEVCGNGNAQIRYVEKTKAFKLRVNVNPKAINIIDRFIEIPLNVYNGKDMLLKAIENGRAMTCRFYKDFKKNEYRVFVSFDKSLSKPEVKTKTRHLGVIGIDINHGFLSVVETDLYGNRKETFDMPLDLSGLSSNQSKDKIAVIVRDITDYAAYVGKPIVLEDLDFSDKKRQLTSGVNVKYNKMLSSFAYNKIISLFEGRCFDKGIEMIKVNPAYSSVQGRLKYKNQGYKISVHQSAAWVLARRGMLLNEKRLVFSEKDHRWSVAEQSISKKEGDFWRLAFTSWRKYKEELSKLRKKKKASLRVTIPDVSTMDGTPLSQTGLSKDGNVQLCPRSK
jgi:IS605 OrfB family transposase